MGLRHGDIALITWAGSPEPSLARYTDCSQPERDDGVDPDDLVAPYWAFFGTEWTLWADDSVRAIRIICLADTIQQWRKEA